MKRGVILAMVSWTLALMALMLLATGQWWSKRAAFYHSRYNKLDEYLEAKEMLLLYLEAYEQNPNLLTLDDDEDQEIVVSHKSANTSFNINKASFDMIHSLLKELNFNNAKDLAAAICAWRGDKETKDIDQKAFDYFGKGYSCKKEEFETLNELNYVKGIENVDYKSIQEFKELLTVKGDGRINVNEVDSKVLSAFLSAIRDDKKSNFDSFKVAELFVKEKENEGIVLADYREFELYLKRIMGNFWTLDFQNNLRLNFSYLRYTDDALILKATRVGAENVLLKIHYDLLTGKIEYRESSL